MKNTQEKNMKNDNLAAIGIGAMIIHRIDSRYCSSYSSHHRTAEKAQQNAQSTGDDTTDEMSGKVQVLNVFVADDSSSKSTSLAAGSDDTNWTSSSDVCDDGAWNDRISGDFGDCKLTHFQVLQR